MLLTGGGLNLLFTGRMFAEESVTRTHAPRSSAKKPEPSDTGDAQLQKQVAKILANQETILQNQTAILQKFDAMMEELRIIKVRASIHGGG